MAMKLIRVWRLGSGVWGKFELRYPGSCEIYATAGSSRLAGKR